MLVANGLRAPRAIARIAALSAQGAASDVSAAEDGVAE